MKNTKLIGVNKDVLAEVDELKLHRARDSWTIKISNMVDKIKSIER